ncbi:MAG: acetate--CoA ligase family protein [Spirochaetia bacterium]|jgi:succinyl-CoA synthetase beta subunit|nr:acetate--CoA ligase family protein [Spirochaetia bacterium]
MNINNWIDGLNISGKPDEWEMKELFRLYNIFTPKGELIKYDDQFKDTNLQNPLVVKVCDPEILHKTDIGGVKLNISDNIEFVVSEMKSMFPGSNILIEEMVPYSGIEFIIGALVDPDFGSALMVGAGGILTELYKDVKFRLAPISKAEAIRMLKELTVADILQGYRGSQMNITSLAELIVSVGDLVNDLGQNFSQLDMNPVVFYEGNWVALDGMAILK